MINIINVNIKFDNHLDIIHYFDKLPSFQEVLILTISQNYLTIFQFPQNL